MEELLWHYWTKTICSFSSLLRNFFLKARLKSKHDTPPTPQQAPDKQVCSSLKGLSSSFWWLYTARCFFFLSVLRKSRFRSVHPITAVFCTCCPISHALLSCHPASFSSWFLRRAEEGLHKTRQMLEYFLSYVFSLFFHNLAESPVKELDQLIHWWSDHTLTLTFSKVNRKVNILTATMPSCGDWAASAALKRGWWHVYSVLGWKDG